MPEPSNVVHLPERRIKETVLPGWWEVFRNRFKQRGECWVYTGELTPAGYGALRVEGEFAFAHRVSLELACGRKLGDDPVEQVCDNPACIRPSHLHRDTPPRRRAPRRKGP